MATTQQQEAINQLRGFSQTSTSFVYNEVPLQEIFAGTVDQYFSAQSPPPSFPGQTIARKVLVNGATAVVTATIESPTGVVVTVPLQTGIWHDIMAARFLSSGSPSATQYFWAY